VITPDFHTAVGCNSLVILPLASHSHLLVIEAIPPDGPRQKCRNNLIKLAPLNSANLLVKFS